MPPWLQILLLAAPMLLWAAAAAIRLHRPPARTLKATWSPELAADLRAFHCLDAEEELIAAISLEVALEIDKEITDNLHVPFPEDRVDWNEERSFAGTDKFLARIKRDPNE
jgi:hypothetical protein